MQYGSSFQVPANRRGSRMILTSLIIIVARCLRGATFPLRVYPDPKTTRGLSSTSACCSAQPVKATTHAVWQPASLQWPKSHRQRLRPLVGHRRRCIFRRDRLHLDVCPRPVLTISATPLALNLRCGRQSLVDRAGEARRAKAEEEVQGADRGEVAD